MLTRQGRHPDTLRHALLGACVLASSLFVSANARADAKTANKLLEDAGVSAPEGCLELSGAKALAERQKQWRAGIDALEKNAPAYLHAWIIGAAKPPALAMSEAKAQRDCLLSAIVEDAATSTEGLILDYGDSHPKTPREMKRVAEKFAKKSSTRAQIIRHFDRSHYRDANGQAFIWYRKVSFTHPRSFNLISPAAAEKCGFTAGHSWRPSSERHKRCWFQHLSEDERQREVLTASSAPGISRHHWGTEFDLFGLNPRHFVPKQRLHDEYVWMKDHALDHGFFQPFLGNDVLGPYTYIEERWHWSYYPIANALTSYIKDNQTEVDTALNAQWDKLEKRWSKKTKYFSFIRAHWRDYVFNVAPVEVSARAPRALPELPWMNPSSLLLPLFV